MVEAYCKRFFGYGRWDAPVWFVGLEEAGDGTPEQLQARLMAWVSAFAASWRACDS